jgi:type IV secretory pathway VirD2 relaxase
MKDEREFRPRPGRIRHGGSRDSRSFVGQVLAATRKAGGPRTLGVARAGRASVFGRGRASSLNALRRVGGRSRSVVIKARVVRQSGAGAPLGVHVTYLQRDGVDRENQPGRLFDREGEEIDGSAFADRCAEDRHHFRFIVSPEDAAELADLKAFTRDLMHQAEADLGTRLDWVAVDHWNTAHPHVHVLVRGVGDDARDLVISRDYISSGLRARASELVTLELGPRTDLQIRRSLAAEIDAERWTKLDRALARDAVSAGGVVDLRPSRGDRADDLRRLKLARVNKLERLGLAAPAGRGRWRLSPDAEPTLQALARRGDVIARIHRSLADGQVERPVERWRLEADGEGGAVVGRLMGRGLDDELRASAWVVIDGVDGRTHHLSLPTLEAATDAPVGAVVETRWLDGRTGRALVLAVRSDLSLDHQISADGATWLDRQLIGQTRAALVDDGFGAQVRAALDRRTERLEVSGLARRAGGRVQFAQNLIETLQRRELAATAGKLAAATGLEHRPIAKGETISGVVRRRLVLASGRFAMIDDGLGFSLVPWRAELERRLGQQVTGVALPGGGFDWTRGRGLGR